MASLKTLASGANAAPTRSPPPTLAQASTRPVFTSLITMAPSCGAAVRSQRSALAWSRSSTDGTSAPERCATSRTIQNAAIPHSARSIPVRYARPRGTAKFRELANADRLR